MNLPRLAAIQELPFSLPVIKNNQAWAINQDTTPQSLVLVEFVFYDELAIQAASQAAIGANNINQSIDSISSDLSILKSRISTVESILDTTGLSPSVSGIAI
jgi:hypothetical protein